MPSQWLFGKELQVFRRGKVWYARCRVNGIQYKESMHVKELSQAIEPAKDWYLGLHGKIKAGIPVRPQKSDVPTFNEMADLFEVEYPVATEGERSPEWVKSHMARLRLHLRPFFGETPVNEIDEAMVLRYRVKRAGELSRQPQLRKRADGSLEPSARPDRRIKIGPSRSTVDDEVCTLSLVLQTAMRHKKLDRLPSLKNPYRKSKKVKRRARFTLEEYKKLYKGIRAKIPTVEARSLWGWEQLYDYVLFMVNSGLRPDEAKKVQFRDVKIIREAGEEILLIEVDGKTGYGPCKSMSGAVSAFKRLKARGKPGILGRARERYYAEKRGEPMPPVVYKYPTPNDLLFPTDLSSLLNEILHELDLKYDRDGQPRVAYSFRHTYICLRLENGADIYQVAKNCRTSVEMIQDNYAIHLHQTIDAGAVNRRKPKSHSVVIEDWDEEEASTGLLVHA